MKNKFLYIFLILNFWACKEDQKNQSSEVKKVFVLSEKMLQNLQLAKVALHPLKNELNFYGKITADNNRLVEIFPMVGGSVVKVYVELGDYVQKGQVLASIRSTEVASYEKELQDAQAELAVAQNNYRVAQDLYEGKLSTQKEVLEMKSQVDKAKSQLERIQEVFKIYSLKAGSLYDIKAPISGFVIQKNITQDMMLRSDRTDNIFDLAEISEVWAIANVNESEISQIKLGLPAEVHTLSYPDRSFMGKVDKIFNIIDPETQSMKVRITLQNKDYALKPEMRANIKIAYEESKQQLAIPAQAVIFDKNRHFVMVFKAKDKIDTRPVEIYRNVGGLAYIQSGLEEGEQVIVGQQLLIYDALND